MRIDGVEIHIEGRGEPIVLLHGWPDTHRVWDAQVQALEAHYRCFRFTLPGFDAAAPKATHTLDEIVALIDKVVQQAGGGDPVTLLLHDWGCFFGYQYALRSPAKVKRIIGVDIGDAGSRRHIAELGAVAKGLTLGYQLWLALAWRVGGRVGTGMARWMARRARARSDFGAITANMGWPYDVQWLRGGFKRAQLFSPSCPMLFIYGRHKPFTFHSRRWAEEIAARPGNVVLALPTGHWVMRQAPAEFNQAILDWLAR
jgi:cis-3-alkyl-4-acyloxetan-2-one decarboxylase